MAWPLLLGFDASRHKLEAADWRDLMPHRDEEQVKLDVDRAFVYYPAGQTQEELSRRKEDLSHLITTVLRRYPALSYFQGYHDIAQVLLLALNPEIAVPALERVSLFRIRDYMLPSLSPSLKHLELIPEILFLRDRKLYLHVTRTQPFFALAGTLTLYAHDIERYSDIGRLYDFFLAHEPVVTLYFYAALILSRRKEILEIPVSEPEMIHFTLSKLPQPLNLEKLIEDTVILYETSPPNKLRHGSWRSIPSTSVLKTSRNIFARKECADGAKLLEKQVKALERQELRRKMIGVAWSYRKPAGSIALTVFVGVLSYWLMRNDVNGWQLWRRCYGVCDRFVRRALHL
ncbi:hypothetical protein KEM55_003244 [Ascosphaera atra]|nr:hypothetical protein KEM55_003244 [Ascosphaera atra]